MKNLGKAINSKRKTIKAIYISSYIPRKCGIATFTKDVTNAINLLNPHALSEIMAVTTEDENLEYPWEVKVKIIRDDLNSYLQAQNYINKSSSDIVVLEHEFGLFGGRCGDYIVPFIESLNKPLVVTCHTVMDDPESEYGQVLKRIIARANAITVMMEESANKLIEKYGVSKNKVVVIPHGTPDLPFNATERAKKKKGLTGRYVLGNINLISDSKGIEYTLKAVAKIAEKIPNVLALIVGQTHPGVLANDGEKYRNSLKALIKRLKIEKNVKFVNKYVTLEELLDWLKAMDVYVTPYLDPQQSSSGALAYAIGAGKLCISTPYLYAKEVLKNNRGILVPFKNSKAIADAVIETWENQEKKKKIAKKAYDFGRTMTWSSVGLSHLDLFEAILRPNKDC